VGSHLAEYLVANGVEVQGTLRPGGSRANLCAFEGALTLYEVDLTDAAGVCQVVAEARPDQVFHLAAQASVARSWQDPAQTMSANIFGQLNVLEALVGAELQPAVLVVGSSEEYGHPRPEELPIKETNPLRPSDPYSVSKVAQDFMGYQYFAGLGLPCVRVRPFNHIGPRQSDSFVTASFARQIAEAEAGLREAVVKVGNLEAQRDFTDVRDVVRAYRLALLKGEPGEVYNLGSGRMVPVQRILDFYLSQARVSIQVEQDPARTRPADVPAVVCDATKLREATGWEPRIPLEQTLTDILNYWREKVTKGKG